MNIKYKILILLAIFFIAKDISAQNCTVNAGIDLILCQNQQINLDGNSQGLITIAAKWSQVGGQSTIISDPNDLSSSVLGYTSGTYKYRIAATCEDGQYVFDEVTFVVNPISNANAGADLNSCPGTETLLGNSVGVGETGKWSIVSSNNAGISIASINDPNSSINIANNVQGSTTVRWTITNNTCSSTDDAIVTNYGGQTPVDAGPDKVLGNCYTTSQSTNLSASIGGNGAGGQIGTWTLVSGPNYPNFSNIHSNTSSVSNLIEGTYILRWTVSGPCVNGYKDMTITVPAATQSVSSANAGADLRFCNGATSAVLSGSYPQFAGETVTWTQTAGPTTATIANIHDPSTSVTGLDGIHSYTFSYTILNSNYGCSNTDGININYSIPPSITITDGDQIVSYGTTSSTIHYSTTGGYRNQYQIIDGPYTNNWTNAGTSSQTINFTQDGTYVVQVRRYADGTECSDAYDQTSITVSSATTPSNAGTDQILACNIVATELAGNQPTIGTGKWTQVSGPNTATINDVYDKSSPISDLIEGKYIFQWTINAGPSGPIEQDRVAVVVSTPTTSTTAAGADQNICGNSIVYLNAQAPAINEIGVWSVTPSAGVVISDIHNPKATVTGIAQNSSYEFIWHVESTCAWAEDTVLIITNSTVGPSIANAGPNQCRPDGTISISMSGNIPTSGTGTWTYIDGPTVPTFTNANANNSTVNGLVNGTYAFEWAISKPGCQTSRDTVWVTATPDASIANAGSDIPLCGTTTSLNATNPTIGTGVWEQVSGNAGITISDINSPTTNLSNLTDGTYWFKWSVAVGVCPETKDTVKVFVSTPPTTANAGLDQIICSATSTSLSANTPTNGTAFWSISGNSSNRPTITTLNSPTSGVSNLVTGQYTLLWNIQSGPFCPISQDTVILSVSAPANAGNDQDLCNSSEVLLTGTDGTNGTWTEVTVNGAVVTPISGYTAIATNLVVEGDYTFKYTVPSIYGCPSTDDEVIIRTSPYGSQPDAGPDQEICTSGGNSTPLAASALGVGSGIWKVLSSPNTPTFSDNSSPTSTLSNLVQGLYILEWEVTYNWCANYSDVVRINVYDPPTNANAGADLATACVLDAKLNATAVTNGIGEWSLFSGPGTITIDNPNLANSTVSSPSATGTYILQWTTKNGSICSVSSDQVSLTFGSPIPPITPDAGIDISVCDNSTTSMNANTISVGTGSWSQFSGPVIATINSVNDPISIISDLTDVGNYLFVWKSTEGYCELTDTVKITIDTTINSDAGIDKLFCEFQSIQLNANDVNPGIGTWSLVSGPTTPIFENAHLFNSKVAGTSLGTYSFKWSVNNGSCNNESTVNIDVVSEPLDNLSVSGDSQCYASDATISINNSQNGTVYNAYIGTTYITQGTGDGNNFDITVPWNKIAIGDNYFSIIADNGSCTSTLTNQALIHVDACSDLEIIKEVGDTIKHVGANIDFTIKVINHGPSDATNTTVNDIIPSGYTYFSDNSGGTYNSGTGIWLIGDLLSGEDTTLTITATVNLTGSYKNIATVTATENDIDPTNNSDSASVEAVPYSDLVIVKTVDNPTPDVGSNVVFKLTVTNNGPNDAPNVIVKDSLPEGYTYVSDDGLGAYNSSTFIWTIGDLVNAGVVSLNITAYVNPSGEYKNIAFVSGDVIEPDSKNNTDSITPVPVPNCDLSVVKTVDIQNAYVGSNVTFSIEVNNNGPSDATNVSVLDKLPSGFLYISDNSLGNYNPSTGIWTIGDMINGASAYLDIIAKVNLTGEYTNSAVVSGDQVDRNPTNDSSAITVTPVPIADLAILKTINVQQEYVNDNIIFTLTAFNLGLSQATNVEVIDLLPSGYTYISDNGNNNYNPSNGIWTIGTLNAYDSISLEITVKINLDGDYTNSASIQADEYDPDETNNTDEATITVIRTILVPEGFSPNGDGINDFFRIKGLEDYPNNKLEIINRWGNRIIILTPYLNDWDGKTIDGKDLPEGTYFYIIDLNDNSKPTKGYVYLKR